MIFSPSACIDHLLCARSFSADIVPTSHETAEVGGCTDTNKVEVTSILIEVCRQRGYTLHKRLPSLILGLSRESFSDEITPKLKKEPLESIGNTKICHEK